MVVTPGVGPGPLPYHGSNALQASAICRRPDSNWIVPKAATLQAATVTLPSTSAKMAGTEGVEPPHGGSEPRVLPIRLCPNKILNIGLLGIEPSLGSDLERVAYKATPGANPQAHKNVRHGIRTHP